MNVKLKFTVLISRPTYLAYICMIHEHVTWSVDSVIYIKSHECSRRFTTATKLTWEMIHVIHVSTEAHSVQQYNISLYYF